jgi:hypothetical protein
MPLKKSPNSKAKISSSSKAKSASAPKLKFDDLGDMTVTLDLRAGKERREGDRRKKDAPVATERRDVGERRAKVSRRRQIDPTTCERDYSNEELEFMSALDDYKRRNGRMFPTCSEILEVLRGIGYAKSTEVAGEPALSDATAHSVAAVPTTGIVPIVALDMVACGSCESAI